MADNKFGIDEVVDTLIDACKAEVASVDAIGGPENFATKLPQIISFALNNYPRVKEAIDDWNTFRAELLDLQPIEAAVVPQRVAAGLTEEEKGKSRIYRAVTTAAQAYVWVMDSVERGKYLSELGKWVIGQVGEEQPAYGQ